MDGPPRRFPAPDPLEEALRGLPQPTIPEGLEDRILAALPRAPRRSARLAKIVLAMAGAASVIAVGVWARSAPTPPRRIRPAALENTSPKFILDPALALNRAPTPSVREPR